MTWRVEKQQLHEGHAAVHSGRPNAAGWLYMFLSCASIKSAVS